MVRPSPSMDRSLLVARKRASKGRERTEFADRSCLILISLSFSSCRALEYQRQIVGRHFHNIGKGKLAALCKRCHVGEIAHAPLRVLASQAAIECSITRRGVLAVAHEGAVHEQATIAAQMPRGSGKQSLRDRPWRDVNHVATENRQKR